MLPVSTLTPFQMGSRERPTLAIDLLLCAVIAIGVVSLIVLAV